MLGGKPCQDQVAFFQNGSCVCLALCDGAGSYDDSQIAARIAVDQLSRYFAASFDEIFPLPAEDISSLIFMHADAISENYQISLNCTLLLAAMNEDGRCITAHIGDGYILSADDCGKREILSHPDNGEEENITWFLSSYDRMDRLRIQKSTYTAGTSIFLCSDGAGCSLVEKTHLTVAKAITTISHWMQQYDGDSVSSQLQIELEEAFRLHSKDDMSLAVLTLLNEESCLYRD